MHPVLRWFLLWPGLLLPAAVFGAAGGQAPTASAPAFSIVLATDRPAALYAAGETATFHLSLRDAAGQPVAGRTVQVAMAREIAPPQTAAVTTQTVPVAVTLTLDRPGFVLVTATYHDVSGAAATARAGVGFSPLEIKAPLTRPDDFLVFWRAQLRDLAARPMEPVLTPVAPIADGQGRVETFDVQLACPGGRPVSGYYSRPVGAKPKSLPAILCLQGAGVRSANRVDWMAAGGTCLAMDINAHGIANGKPAEYYRQLEAGELAGYPGFGAGNRDACYFRGMFLRVARALQFLKAQPEWDGRTLVTWGSSQGGAQALAGAALDPQVTFCAALVPGLCNLSGQAGGLNAGWPGWVVYRDGRPADPAIAKTAPYFDLVNFAPEIKAQTYIDAGLIDTTCPPSGIYAVFNAIRAPKEILTYPRNGHGYYTAESYARLWKYLANQQSHK
ncbi:MAG: acetylxylan esterase [Lentisphaeria bacterium]